MKKKWIAKAIRRKGGLRETARAKGLIKGDEKLSSGDLSKLAKSGDTTTKRRVNLARTLKKIRNRKKAA
jgi:hypothetical protein